MSVIPLRSEISSRGARMLRTALGGDIARWLDEPDVMIALVERLAADLSIPVTVKLRLLPDRDASIALCKRLEEAGASALCLHGRTREQNKQYAGSADWEPIRDVVSALGIPVIANGGIETRADVDACLEYTGAAAVMSSEALLENPALFCSKACFAVAWRGGHKAECKKALLWKRR